ncbi:hypothetical protein BST14_18310 [Mycobacterium arosiense ATCC BAA-1401 = DSM 45069]|uniref:DUF5135 domain-containing protein n=1 Tax=Mycobacterium arosiense ATCC BAA-1401 = DSM 45069 TaxID=1265311 RepID=A0A1W9ZBW5_MYCAI|nr:hypothetical protein BST14_18310 [Mycobacterium arosiense ATCC BAA-1401 = DSM 45069]
MCFAVVEIWTIAAWLPDAHQVTEYRDHGGVRPTAALAYELASLTVFVVVATIVVRGCIRERRLTFDAMFMIAGLTCFWADLSVNLFAPALLFSSDFVNLTNPLGHLPGIVNPDAGRAPDPLLFSIPLESAGLLGGAMLMGAAIKRVRHRHPTLTRRQLALLIFSMALVMDAVLEPVLMRLGLEAYLAPRWMSPFDFGGGQRFPVVEWIAGAAFFSLPVMIRTFKNDRNQTIVEQRIDHLPPIRRRVVALLALYGCFQLIAWGPATIPDLLYVPYETSWPHISPDLLNGVCDAPGVTGTRYGPCPGAPGFHMPVRGSLPGKSP